MSYIKLLLYKVTWKCVNKCAPACKSTGSILWPSFTCSPMPLKKRTYGLFNWERFHFHLVMLSPNPVRRSFREPSILLNTVVDGAFSGQLLPQSERGMGWRYEKLHGLYDIRCTICSSFKLNHSWLIVAPVQLHTIKAQHRCCHIQDWHETENLVVVSHRRLRRYLGQNRFFNWATRKQFHLLASFYLTSVPRKVECVGGWWPGCERAEVGWSLYWKLSNIHDNIF